MNQSNAAGRLLAPEKRSLGRLIQQFQHIRKNSDYSDPQELTAKSRLSHYDIHGSELIKSQGLQLNQIETSMIIYLEQIFKRSIKVLVVGCGFGRECFALEKRGHQVTGIDTDPECLDIAGKTQEKMVSKIKFSQIEMHQATSGEWDLVWLRGPHLSAMAGHERRVQFLLDCRKHLVEKGRLVAFPLIQKFKFNSREYWKSYALKLNWKSKQKVWQPGDTLISTQRLDTRANYQYIHVYQSIESAAQEFQAAHLVLENKIESAWLFKL